MMSTLRTEYRNGQAYRTEAAPLHNCVKCGRMRDCSYEGPGLYVCTECLVGAPSEDVLAGMTPGYRVQSRYFAYAMRYERDYLRYWQLTWQGMHDLAKPYQRGAFRYERASHHATRCDKFYGLPRW